MDLTNTVLVSIVSALIPGLIVLWVQERNARRKEERKNYEDMFIRSSPNKILDEAFLSTYQPGIHIDKVIQDLGKF
jgi:hypothetical protein